MDQTILERLNAPVKPMTFSTSSGISASEARPGFVALIKLVSPLARVTVEGAHLWSRTRHKLLPIYQIAGLDPELIQGSRENLRSYFQAKGYFDVAVQSDIVPTQQEQASGEPIQQGQNIVFRVIKGPRHQVKDVTVVAGETIPDDKTREQLKVKTGRFFSRGVFSERLVKTSSGPLGKIWEQAFGPSAVLLPVRRDLHEDDVLNFRASEFA